MRNAVRVKVQWLLGEEDGRPKVPKVPRVMCQVVLDSEGSDPEHPFGQWSLVLEFDEWHGGRGETRGAACYLSDEAPHEKLRPGEAFRLYRGTKLVGRGCVEPADEHVFGAA